MDTKIKFEDLKDKTISKIEGLKSGSDVVRFWTSDGHKYQMDHSQDCCETVQIEDIIGDISDLLDFPILQASEETSGEHPTDWKQTETRYISDSITWTFYRLSTIKGTVVIRWLGESNGYYSESVDFYEVEL